MLVLLAPLGAALIYSALDADGTEEISPAASGINETGLQPVDCWFDQHLSSAECYRMWVPEKRSSQASRLINFPVVIFRADDETEKRPPLLHLGAGGPGAPMYLDSSALIDGLLSGLSVFSLELGRDLVVIDPRGAGLAEPLLVCRSFVDNERDRLRRSLTLREYMLESVTDEETCVDEYLALGVDLSAYNSLAIAQDVEALRKAAGVERWALLGVSYGANYALKIADLYPETVESLVLDSAYVSKIGLHEYFLESVLGPYELLFDYCDVDPECERPIANIENRFWDLEQKFDADPVMLTVRLENGEAVEILLDGDRFVGAIMLAIYNPLIFRDLPGIITGLERGDLSNIEIYVEDYVRYLLDPSWSDISQMAHYCNEEKAQIDFTRIEALLDRLPAGFIRENARLAVEWPDQCDRMLIEETAPVAIPSRRSTIPTLFLHGYLDVITPLENVRKITRYFGDYRLLVLNVGHGVLPSAGCSRTATAKFLSDPDVSSEQLNRYCMTNG